MLAEYLILQDKEHLLCVSVAQIDFVCVCVCVCARAYVHACTECNASFFLWLKKKLWAASKAHSSILSDLKAAITYLIPNSTKKLSQFKQALVVWWGSEGTDTAAPA